MENILKPLFKALGDYIQDVLLPMWKNNFSFILGAVKWAFETIGVVWNEVLKPILDGIIEFIGGIFSGDWSKIWDGIVSILDGIWGAVKMVIWTPIEWVIDKIGGIVDWITKPFRDAANAIGDVWSSIKSVFKLPHFTLSGTLNPLKWIEEGMPSIGVDWYYNGGIFTEPTILGNGMGVGDKFNGKGSNAEAVLPLDSLYENMRDIVREETKGGIIQHINIYAKTDSPSELARQFEKSQKRMGFGFS